MSTRKSRKAAKTTAVATTAANQVTPKKRSRKEDAPAPLATAAQKDARNPFKADSIAGKVTARLLSGASFDLVSLFDGIQSKLPSAILMDVRRKLPVQFDKTTKQYSLARVK